MDTKQTPSPTRNPLKGTDRDEAPSRLRVLAMSAAIAGLTATGGLAMIASSSVGPAAATTTGATTTVAPQATTATATTAPAASNGAPQGPGGQAPAGATGPGHATSGGS